MLHKEMWWKATEPHKKQNIILKDQENVKIKIKKVGCRIICGKRQRDNIFVMFFVFFRFLPSLTEKKVSIAVLNSDVFLRSISAALDRGILQRSCGEIALLSNKKHKISNLPGGGRHFNVPRALDSTLVDRACIFLYSIYTAMLR